MLFYFVNYDKTPPTRSGISMFPLLPASAWSRASEIDSHMWSHAGVIVFYFYSMGHPCPPFAGIPGIHGEVEPRVRAHSSQGTMKASIPAIPRKAVAAACS